MYFFQLSFVASMSFIIGMSAGAVVMKTRLKGGTHEVRQKGGHGVKPVATARPLSVSLTSEGNRLRHTVSRRFPAPTGITKTILTIHITPKGVSVMSNSNKARKKKRATAAKRKTEQAKKQRKGKNERICIDVKRSKKTGRFMKK